MNFTAGVLLAPGAALSIETVSAPRLLPGDVLVRIEAAGLCHTDWEAARSTFAAATPIVLGHEGAGVVVEVGSDVRAARPGDHVVCSPFPVCGHCFYCERRQPMLCEPVTAGHAAGRLPDGEPRLFLDGRPVGQFFAISSFAQYAIVPEAGVVRIPREVPFASACLIGCAAITGVGAVIRVAQVRPGESVCVVGCGPVGLNAVQGARLAGAGIIVASDIDPGRRAMAETFGATHVVDPRAASLTGEVRRLTGSRGADHAFETAGREETLQAALDASRPGGSVTILGKMPPDNRVAIRFGSLMGDRRIRRSSLGGGEAQADFAVMAQAYLDGRLMLDELITETIGFDELDAAIERVGRGETVRTVLLPHQERPRHGEPSAGVSAGKP